MHLFIRLEIGDRGKLEEWKRKKTCHELWQRLRRGVSIVAMMGKDGRAGDYLLREESGELPDAERRRRVGGDLWTIRMWLGDFYIYMKLLGCMI